MILWVGRHYLGPPTISPPLLWSGRLIDFHFLCQVALLQYQMKVDVDQCTSQVFYQAWGDCFTKDLVEEGSPMHLVMNLVSNLSPNSVIRHVIFWDNHKNDYWLWIYFTNLSQTQISVWFLYQQSVSQWSVYLNRIVAKVFTFTDIREN